MSDETPRLKLPQLVSMQEMNSVTWNEALAQLDAMVDLCLLGQYINNPPGSPSDGDAYLVGGAPAGAWSGYAYKIASCLDGQWRFYTPFNGLRAYVTTTGAFIVYLGGVWLSLSDPPSVAGNWTPVLTTDGTPGSPEYVNCTGIYKVVGGDRVMASGRIQASAWNGSPTGNVIIAGLPFAAATFATGQAGCVGYVSRLALNGGYTTVGLLTINGAQRAAITKCGNGMSAVYASVSDLSFPFDINFTLNYFK